MPQNSRRLFLSRKLRQHQTECEKRLWYALRNRQLNGCKFRRQHPVGRYIPDFVCVEKKIIIELDGSQHASNPEDIQRDICLKQSGYEIIRVWNNEIIENLSGVLEMIWHKLQDKP